MYESLWENVNKILATQRSKYDRDLKFYTNIDWYILHELVKSLIVYSWSIGNLFYLNESVKSVLFS